MKKTIFFNFLECKLHLYVVEKNKDIDNKSKQIYSKHKKEKLKEDEELSCGLTIPMFTDYYIIIRKGKDIINILFHEISHSVDLILGDRSINDEEVRAYMLAYIGETFLKQIQ